MVRKPARTETAEHSYKAPGGFRCCSGNACPGYGVLGGTMQQGRLSHRKGEQVNTVF